MFLPAGNSLPESGTSAISLPRCFPNCLANLIVLLLLFDIDILHGNSVSAAAGQVMVLDIHALEQSPVLAEG